MTCLEKLKQDHPDFTGDNIDYIVTVDCPDDWGICVATPKYCGDANSCDRCWNREIPGTEMDPITDAIHKVGEAAKCAASAIHDATVSVILDSGERRQFYDANGNPMGVRDIQEGKGRCDLMPLDVVAWMLGGCDDVDAILNATYLFVSSGNVLFLYDAIEYFRNLLGVDVPTLFLEVAKHFEDGAKKYGENNWQKGIPVRCYIDSAVRHYLKYIRGDKDEPHDLAFCWNILCAIWTCKHKPELNDYARKDGDDQC